MNEEDRNQGLPATLSTKSILGLSDKGNTDAIDVRKLQLQSVRDKPLPRLILSLLFVAVVSVVFHTAAPFWASATWAGLSAFVALFSFFQFRQYWTLTGQYSEEANLPMITLHSFATAVTWSSAFILLGIYGNESQLLILWSATLAMTIFASFLMPTWPRASTIFTVITTLAAVVAAIIVKSYFIVVVAIVVSSLLIMLSIRSARAQLLHSYASDILQEKSETVSLLLKEFEDSGADWLWQTDTQRCAVAVGPRFGYALEAEPSNIEGQPLLKLIAGDSWEDGKYPKALHDLANKLKKKEPFSNLIVPVKINGKQRHWELSASPILSDDNNFLGFRGVGSDVTEQRQSEEKISHLARYDTLTGLPNRLQLTESLSDALADADKWRRRCGFFMIDLDRFKAVNDTLGHPIGDRLLAQVAKRLQVIMTDNEVCGRLGGDEFAVVLKDASDSAYVSTLARRIIDGLSRPYTVDQNTLYIGTSVGSAVGPQDGRTVELLMRSADLALYRSKDQGGNSHNNYQHKLHTHAEERRQMEFELRNAIEKRQLHVEYQPLVASSSDHTLLGFETLVRWNSPKFGNVSPGKFIPVAEDVRLIIPIGDFVLRQACMDAMSWPQSTSVAVNISVDQLTSPGFFDTVVSALSDSKLPAWRLELEVTESIFINDGGYSLKILEKLRGLGCKLSLDDFGTGYSSLGYLKDVRFDTIKIDRSFVQGAAQNKKESLAIIRAVVAMAQSMEVSTTAEGVETENELMMIQQLGCHKIQGFYFGRPMLFNDACELFRQVPSIRQAG